MELTEKSFYSHIENSEKPVLVDFFATWCPPCRALGPILEKVAFSLQEKIIFLKLNIDEAPLIAQKYGIEQVPTVMLFKEGKPLSGFIGLKSETEIKQWLNECLN